MTPELQYRIEQFLYRKSALCDAQDWDAYLALFDPAVEFHLPQWDSEHDYTRDPRTGMSLIYYSSRAGLEDRVFRIRTGKSAACTKRSPYSLTTLTSTGQFSLRRRSASARPSPVPAMQKITAYTPVA